MALEFTIRLSPISQINVPHSTNMPTGNMSSHPGIVMGNVPSLSVQKSGGVSLMSPILHSGSINVSIKYRMGRLLQGDYLMNDG